jgi:hypothetical protein
MTIVVRFLESSDNAVWIWRSVLVSRAEVASSRSMILGFLRIVRAIATLCLSPPLRRRPRSPTREEYPSGNSWIRS